VVVVEDRVIQQLFGHADIRSVQAYARIEDSTLREAMARLHLHSVDK
jgi:site-specific recombinase XerD